MAKPILKTIGLSKTYEGNGKSVRALSNVNLEIMKIVEDSGSSSASPSQSIYVEQMPEIKS